MIPIEGQPILTAAAMRGAEERGVAAGTSLTTLMERAGEGVAAAVRRLAAGAEMLILCGPGNNGGDGYVAARLLAAAGHPVRIAASAEPVTALARAARDRWTGPVEALDAAGPAPICVDALFGIGLSRHVGDDIAHALRQLVGAAHLGIAVDVPSGIDADDGAAPGDLPTYDLTLALGAIKPAHVLQPGAARCGTVRLIDIGIDAAADTHVLAPRRLPVPGPATHKFSRGMVAVVKGRMAGAAQLAAVAAMHAGAGYVVLLGASLPGPPHALVRRPFDEDALSDPRIGAVVIGPGLGRDDGMRDLLHRVLASDRALVVDGDALRLVTPEMLAARGGPIVLTPHAGEFAGLFGAYEGSKIDAARGAAQRSGATVVFKGADTVIAEPSGRAAVATNASAWASTAGSGDVLAGAIGAALAAGLSPFEAASAGVWMHGTAARRLGPAFVADDLATALAATRADR
jgi:hydroxyethylthiazole kinase-like uncharacterized protein yjeF